MQDVDVLPPSCDLAQVFDLLPAEVDKEELAEGRIDTEGLERASRNHFSTRLAEMFACAGESIDVDVVQSTLVGEDLRVGARILAENGQLDLGPLANLIEFGYARHTSA